MFIRVMPSLGDAVYCRPFVRAFATRIETRWPELFSDLRLSGEDGPVVEPKYASKHLALHNIPNAIGRFFPRPDAFVFDLPAFPKPGGDYVVIRPPSLRRRFYAPARNPESQYIRRSVEILRSYGIRTVGIGNISQDEWFDGDPPEVDEAYWTGLQIEKLMGLISGATLIVAGPGFTVPVSIAYRVPHIIVYGGAGRWNRIEKLTDPRMGLVSIQTIEPDNFCMGCKSVLHECNKTISDFEMKFKNAINHSMHLR